ncbi:phosphopantetheine-binding protein [Pedobacter steynii]
MLLEIWTTNLGISQIGITDDFFELGGHSLIAVKVMGAIERKQACAFLYQAYLRTPPSKHLLNY